MDPTPTLNNRLAPDVTSSRRLLTEGLVIAAVPVAGSFVAFVFEAGYLAFYEVPITLIQLDFTRVITASGVVILVLLTLLILFSNIVDIAQGSHPFRRILGKMLIVALFFVTFFAVIPGPPGRWWALVGLLLLLLSLELLPPLFQRHTGLKYWDRIAAAKPAENKTSETHAYGSFSEAVGALIVTPMSFVFFGTVLVFFLGVYHAQSKTSYWVLMAQPDMLVVAHYGDTVILKKFDVSSKQIMDVLVVRKVSDSAPLNMKQVALGELKSPKHMP